LRENYQLEDPEDIAFIKSKAQQYTATLLGAFATSSPAGPNSKAATCRKLDRMRFIECMAQDHIKPLYFTTNEVMSRAELDSRNSTTAGARRNDFFEEITKEFNNENFVPMSRILPDLHFEFAESVELPLSEYRMSPEKAKAIISSMRPQIMKIIQRYELSGNGDGQLTNDDDDTHNNPPAFNATNCIGGDTKAAFLAAGEGTDVLYWWHVLEIEGMLQYTTSSLAESGAGCDSVPLAVSLPNHTDKRKKQTMTTSVCLSISLD
jgi:hypothetical protein